MRKYRLRRVRVIDIDKVIEIEPAFAERRADIVGATYTPDDESGDAFKYTQALARVCEKMGAKFLYGTQVTALGADRVLEAGAFGRGERTGRLSQFARARHRGQPRLLVGAALAALWRAAEYLSGQGLFGDDPDRQIQCRAGDEPDRRRIQTGLFQSRRPFARRRHRRIVGLFASISISGAARRSCAMCAICFRAQAISPVPPIGQDCVRRRPRTFPISAARVIAISGSIPATARWAGRSARALAIRIANMIAANEGPVVA